MSVPLTFVAFDILRINGCDLTEESYNERRRILEGLNLSGPSWTTSETFDDGQALFAAVCKLGFEGVVAKNSMSRRTSGAGSRSRIRRTGVAT